MFSGLGVARYGQSRRVTSRYFLSKLTAETLAFGSGLDAVVFRPSYVVGPGDGFVPSVLRAMQAGEVERPGDGSYRMQPIAVADAAAAVLAAVVAPRCAFPTVFDLVGPEAVPYAHAARAARGRRARPRTRRAAARAGGRDRRGRAARAERGRLPGHGAGRARLPAVRRGRGPRPARGARRPARSSRSTRRSPPRCGRWPPSEAALARPARRWPRWTWPWSAPAWPRSWRRSSSHVAARASSWSGRGGEASRARARPGAARLRPPLPERRGRDRARGRAAGVGGGMREPAAAEGVRRRGRRQARLPRPRQLPAGAHACAGRGARRERGHAARRRLSGRVPRPLHARDPLRHVGLSGAYWAAGDAELDAEALLDAAREAAHAAHVGLLPGAVRAVREEASGVRLELESGSLRAGAAVVAPDAAASALVPEVAPLLSCAGSSRLVLAPLAGATLPTALRTADGRDRVAVARRQRAAGRDGWPEARRTARPGCRSSPRACRSTSGRRARSRWLATRRSTACRSWASCSTARSPWPAASPASRRASPSRRRAGSRTRCMRGTDPTPEALRATRAPRRLPDV